MRKHHCHEILSEIQPPRVGPTAGATTTATPKKRLKIPGHSAEHRAHSEQTEADQEESLAAKTVGHIAGRSDNNGIGNEIGGYHPGRFVLTDAQAACNIVQ